jgi:hypothetical protein
MKIKILITVLFLYLGVINLEAMMSCSCSETIGGFTYNYSYGVPSGGCCNGTPVAGGYLSIWGYDSNGYPYQDWAGLIAGISAQYNCCTR